jgi:2-polyprenyl-6-methoxyphenol hydroxylase-like FAD-dependent oxidoreductase
MPLNPPIDADVLVAGGGIAGIAAALALARAGQHVQLLERAATFGEIGAGLQIGPNAVRALDQLGVLDAVLANSVLPRRGVIFDAISGAELTAIDFGEGFRARYGYPYLVMHRRDLLDVLLDAGRAESGIEFVNGLAVDAVRDLGELAEVDLTDGSVRRYGVVVGADGIRSAVRRGIDDSEPVFHGHVAFRGTVPTAEVADFVGAQDVALWIAPNMHLMQYPIRGGELYNQVAVIKSTKWLAGAQEWGGRDELEQAFSSVSEPVRRSIAQIGADRGSVVCDREPLERWSAGRSVLVGDAAHAMLQYLGQGAAQALEDAVALGASFALSADHCLAFKAYEDARVARASACQRVARPWGELWHTGDELTRTVRDRYFRLRRDDDYEEFDWLYAEPDNKTREL